MLYCDVFANFDPQRILVVLCEQSRHVPFTRRKNAEGASFAGVIDSVLTPLVES